jgi:hypothetical protein
MHSFDDTPFIFMGWQWLSRGMAGSIAEAACSHDIHRAITTSFRLGVQVLGSASQEDGLSLRQTEACNHCRGIFVPHWQVAVVAAVVLPASSSTPKGGKAIRHDGLQVS